MLATIVVPLDGSDFSARAIPYATGLARSAGAKLAFLRVLPHRAPGNAVDELQAIQATLEMDANTARADGLQVDAIVRRIRPVQAQDVARTISRFADEQRAGLIVMSTHGRGGLGRWVYGSVADSVLRQSPTPVLLVPPRAERSLPADRRLRLLVPLDGSERAEEAIATAELLAQLLDAELTLLHVVEPPDYPLHGEGYAYVPWDQDAELSSARQYLQAHVDRLQAQGIMVSAQAATGKPTWVVAQVVRDVEPDIVMMATHGRSGLVRLVLGSVATSVLQQVDVPVLLVRPGALPRSDEAPSDAHERPDGAATVATATARSCPRVDVALSLTDLELIERGLRTLAYTPGYDYHLAPRIRELVGRLEGAGHGLETAEPARAPALTSKQ
ncbi:MAG: universal stress protein [Chloroflexi bacterium]|nr:universal stress protein [Chloroflexota bacterium]